MQFKRRYCYEHSKCIRGIKGESVEMGKIEAFFGNYGLENNIEIENYPEYNKLDKKVVVIESGPAGISCAAILKRLGVEQVDI